MLVKRARFLDVLKQAGFRGRIRLDGSACRFAHPVDPKSSGTRCILVLLAHGLAGGHGFKAVGGKQIRKRDGREEVDVLDAEFLIRRIRPPAEPAAVRDLGVDAASRRQHRAHAFQGAGQIADVLQNSNHDITKSYGVEQEWECRTGSLSAPGNFVPRFHAARALPGDGSSPLNIGETPSSRSSDNRRPVEQPSSTTREERRTNGGLHAGDDIVEALFVGGRDSFPPLCS